MKTESGKDRVDKAKDRLDAKIAEMVEEMADGPNHTKEANTERQQDDRIDKRRSDTGEMDEDFNKVRKINSETEEEESMSTPGSPDNEPDTKLRTLADVDDDMLDSMDEVEPSCSHPWS